MVLAALANQPRWPVAGRHQCLPGAGAASGTGKKCERRGFRRASLDSSLGSCGCRCGVPGSCPGKSVNTAVLPGLGDSGEMGAMEQSAAELRGMVLRAWREHAGMSRARLAEAIPASAASVSMWESGTRGARNSPAADYVRVLGLGEYESMALVDMCFAAGSVTMTVPRTRWAHNFQAPPTPVWAWLRPSAVGADGVTNLTVANWWGEALQGSVTISCGPGGVLLQYPTAVTNPPLEATLSAPGWADFGRGVILAGVAAGVGATLIDARRIIASSTPLDPPLDADEQRETRRSGAFKSARRLVARLDVSWRVFAPHLGMIKPRHDTYSLDGSSFQPTTWPGTVVTREDGTVERQALLSGAQLRAVREGRGLSREEVTRQVSSVLPGHVLSTHALEMLEKTGKLPDADGVIAALDHVYQCDGRLGIDRVFDSRSAHPLPGKPYTVTFPVFYTGPVWVQATGRDGNDVGTVDLTWGPWRRRQRVRSGMLLTTRKSWPDAVPLTVTVPRGWLVSAGIGAAPTAADISHGWHPVSLRAALAMLRDGVDAIITSQQIPLAERNGQPERPASAASGGGAGRDGAVESR